MTGTALTEEEEFREIYGLDVIEIPPNKKVIRVIMMILYSVHTERRSMPLLKRLLRHIRRDSLFWLVQSPSKALKKSAIV